MNSKKKLDPHRKLDLLTKFLVRPKRYLIIKALQKYMEEYEDYLIQLHIQ